MIEKKQIQKIVASILRRKDGLPDHQIMHPFREWLISLSVTAVLLGIMVLSCVRLYQHYNDLTPEPESDDTIQTTNIIYRPEEVSTSLEFFESKRARYAELRESIDRHKTILPIETPQSTTTEAVGVSTTTTQTEVPVSTEQPPVVQPETVLPVTPTPPATEAI
jgi:hypothetical protein